MKLVLIHGAPAAGKLTTARALLSQVQGRLFDNHVAIDFARTIFDFGASGFWELVDRVRGDALDVAAERQLPLLVMTCVYVEPEDVAAMALFLASKSAAKCTGREYYIDAGYYGDGA